MPEALSTSMAQQTAITIADYAIGGTVAGFAGALARRTALINLTTTGCVLGILAGTVQAASNAAEDHWTEADATDVHRNEDCNEQS